MADVSGEVVEVGEGPASPLHTAEAAREIGDKTGVRWSPCELDLVGVESPHPE